MNVDRILAAKGSEVATIRPTDSVRDLVRALRDRNIGAMVVSRDGRTVDGIVSERDVVRALADRGASIVERQVVEVMTRSVVTASPGDSVKQLMAEMTRRRVRHLPVVADGELVGIVSIGDVVKNRLEEMATETNVLREAYLARR